MADKIVKAFEVLRNHYLQESTQAVALAQKNLAEGGSEIPGSNIKKKDVSLTSRERINYCNVISDFLPMQSIKDINEFPRLLTLAMELLLVSCDDNDADVRLVAGESINKIMKAFLDSQFGRIQVELYKEMKKNGSSRSLRAAMQRFGDTCHLIRNHKRRPYVANMLPCIVKIAKREDDSVHETLGVLMAKLVPILGGFMNKGDIKILLSSFLPNLKSSSATVRRTASSSLNVLCQHSVNPTHFYSWLISMLLGMITPLTEDLPPHTILGVLSCLKSIVPNLDTDGEKPGIKGTYGTKKSTLGLNKKVQCLDMKQYLQIYEVTMFCTKHKDHNVVTASLENLYQILQCHAKPLLDILLSPSGIAPTITGQLAPLGVDFQGKDTLAPSEAGDSGVASDLHSLSSMSLNSESLDGKEKQDILDASLSSDSNLDETREGPLFSAIPVIPTFQAVNTENAIEDVATDANEEEIKDNMEDENEGLNLPRTYTQGSIVNIEEGSLDGPRDRLGSTFLEIQGGGSQTSLEELIRNESICSTDVKAKIERQFNIDAVACTGVPLLNCVRLMCSFLLSGEPGKTLPDSSTRVSVKSLSLHCIGAALRLYPEAIMAKVLPDELAVNESSNKQLVREVLLLRTHEDPQIRGGVAGIIGHFIQAAMVVSMGNFETWNSAIAEKYGTERLDLQKCLKVIMELFKDESSVAVKQNCHATKSCILALCESDYNMFAYELVRQLLTLHNSSYWLVKTEVLDIFFQLDYRLLQILESHWFSYRNLSTLNRKFVNIQEQVVELMVMWLGDEDPRVRQAAEVAVVKIIPNLYYSEKLEQQEILCAALKFHRLKDVSHLNHSLIERNLSAVLRKLYEMQDASSSKYFIHGCIQCYYLLSETYPPTIFPYAWEILPPLSLKSAATSTSTLTVGGSPTKNQTLTARKLDFTLGVSSSLSNNVVISSCGILSVTFELISAGWMILDLNAHQDALKLCVHLLCGAAKRLFKSKQTDSEEEVTPTSSNTYDAGLTDGWKSLRDARIISFAKRIFVHITQVLHVLTHVIEQSNPLAGVKQITIPVKERTPLPGNVTNTSNTPTTTTNMATSQSTSPRKFTFPKAMQRKTESDVEQSKTPDTNNTSTPTVESKQTTPQVTPSHQPSEKSEKLGMFQHLPHFMKLYEILKGSFRNYQVSSVFSGLDKFSGFLKGILEAFSMILELATFNELSSHVEEFLEYMKATARVEEELTFLAVQQLLKGLFGTNAASDSDMYKLASNTKTLLEVRGDTTFSFDKHYEQTNLNLDPIPQYGRLYEGCFLSAYNGMCASMKLVPIAEANSLERGSKAMSLFKSFKKTMTMNRPSVKVSKESVTSIQSYIRLFEPLVIHALKAYTTASSTTLQCQAIHLLDQLIRLRVNYSLLDSDQVFIGFVLKQFEYINNGQISMPEIFIPTIFQFLVLLSYECYQQKFAQAKAIIGMPKIILLCDEIMACEQPPRTHAIPALKPIVQDLFASQSQTRPDSSKELDTQREVVVSMLLRVVQYSEALQMLTTVLNGSKMDDEKWKRLSRLIIDTLLPSLSKLEIQINSMADLQLLFLLLDSVAPSALRPADIILKSLFDVHMPVSVVEMTRALSMVVALLRTLLTQNREDTIFSRMQQIDASFIRPCFQVNESDKDFALKKTKNDQYSAHYLASFILHFAQLAVDKIRKSYNDLCTDHRRLTVLVELLEQFLVLLSYLGKSGSFKMLSCSILSVIQKQTSDASTVLLTIHQSLKSLAEREPLCMLHWLFFLQSVGVENPQFWRQNFTSSTLLQISSEENIVWKGKLIEKGSFLLYCEIVTSHLKEQKSGNIAEIKDLLKNKIAEILLHLNEPPVKELVSRMLQHAELTMIFIEIVSYAITPQFLKQKFSSLKLLLHHLESVDLSYSVGIINLLLHILPNLKIYGLARKAETLACRRVEYIQSLPDQQTSLSLGNLKSFSENKLLMKRFPRLCSSIQRMEKKLSPTSALSSHPLDSADVNLKDYVIKKEWMYMFVERHCFKHHKNDFQRRSAVRLLRSLSLENMRTIMENKDFSLDLLETCIVEAQFNDEATKHKTGNNTAKIDLHENFTTGSSSERENKDQLLALSKIITLQHVQSLLQNKLEIHTYNNLNYSLFKEDSVQNLQQDPKTLVNYVLVLKCVLRFLSPSCYYNQSWNIAFDDGIHITKFILMLPLLCEFDLLVKKEILVNLELCFYALSLLLHCQELSLCLMDQPCALMLVKTIDSVYTMVKHLTLNYGDEVANLSKSMKENDSLDLNHTKEWQNPFQIGCEKVSDLLDGLKNMVSMRKFKGDKIPKFLFCHLHKTIIGLARLPFINSYVRIPPIVWKFGWDPKSEGLFNTELPPLPVDIMKEKDVLKEFVYRANQVGWTSKMQYEETWAALLGVLSSPPVTEDSSTEEDIELAEASCLAVHCITSLILETTLSPVPGNPAISRYSVIHRPRDYPLLSTNTGKKLLAIRREIEMIHNERISCISNPFSAFLNPVVPSLLSAKQRKQHLCNGCMMEAKLYVSNLELPVGYLQQFNLGQISASAIRTRLVTSDVQEDTDSDDSDSVIIQVKEKSFTGSVSSDTPYRKLDELDIRSCLQFLLELFEQWLSPFAIPKTPLMLKMEAIKSLCVLSDLLLELNHYEWILGILMEFTQNHPVEDEILMQYLIPTVCKALAVLKLEGQIAERICRQVELSIKSPHLPLQVACLSGSLYILESFVNSTNFILVPILTEFLTKKLQISQESGMVTDSKRYLVGLWSVAFYLIEHCSSEIQDPQFASTILEIAINELWKPVDSTSTGVQQILFRGLERLTVSQALTRTECERLSKVAAKCISLGSSENVLPALGLLCTCIYTSKESEQSGGSSPESSMDEMNDSKMVMMERINVLLTRIRKGTLVEANLLSTILPRILLDFLPVREVMNKLISDFLSSQQLRPEMVAKIFNKVSDMLYKNGEEEVVREWVFLCIGSFVQRTPLSMAVWSLTCFFVSSSTNPWLKALFPYVVERKGMLEEDDKKLFVMAALDFFTTQNLDEVQQKQFLHTFRSKADHPSSPYGLLVSCCSKIVQR